MRFSKYLAIAALTLASATTFAAECSVEISANDQMQFSTKEIKVPKQCKQFSVTLTHTGKLAANVMGHNWVLTTAEDMQGVVTDALSAGPSKQYLKPDDSRVLAATKMLGGGQKDTISFDTSKLAGNKKYIFFCSFPGHSGIMKGELSVSN